MERSYWYEALLDDDVPEEAKNRLKGERRYREGPLPFPSTEAKANLIGSLTGDFGGSAHNPQSLHMPCIDLDVPAQLVPSSTPGHSHLYIDVPLTWTEYRLLLSLLARLGIVEPNYVKASEAQGMTFVRKPGVKKAGAPTLTDAEHAMADALQGLD